MVSLEETNTFGMEDLSSERSLGETIRVVHKNETEGGITCPSLWVSCSPASKDCTNCFLRILLNKPVPHSEVLSKTEKWQTGSRTLVRKKSQRSLKSCKTLWF